MNEFGLTKEGPIKLKHNIGILFEYMDCPGCGINFAMPERVAEWKKQNRKEFYCPNGHNLHFPETEEQKKEAGVVVDLRQEVETQRNEREYFLRKLQEVNKRIPYYKGQITKLKNKMKEGNDGRTRKKSKD